GDVPAPAATAAMRCFNSAGSFRVVAGMSILLEVLPGYHPSAVPGNPDTLVAVGAVCHEEPVAARLDTGSTTVNVVPLPGPSLATVIRPPCSPTRCRVMARPSPSPPLSRLVTGSACRNRSNMNGRNSLVRPFPVSSTTSSAYDPTSWRRTPTRPPGGVNLTALLTRFQTICWSRSASPTTGPVGGVTLTSSRTPFASDSG